VPLNISSKATWVSWKPIFVNTISMGEALDTDIIKGLLEVLLHTLLDLLDLRQSQQ
jgi:hypothetical protein